MLTINAVIVAINKIATSNPLKTKPTFMIYLASFSNDAPAITGIAKKNVNSAATLLSKPINNPPIIVDPLLDVPGISANN